RSYRPGSYAGRVHLLRAAGPGSTSDDPTLGWGAHSQDIEVHDLQADHFTILREPTVDIVAAKLEAWSGAALDPKSHPEAGKGRRRERTSVPDPHHPTGSATS